MRGCGRRSAACARAGHVPSEEPQRRTGPGGPLPPGRKQGRGSAKPAVHARALCVRPGRSRPGSERRHCHDFALRLPRT